MGSVFTPESLLCLQQCGTADRMKLSVLTWNYSSHDIDNDVVGRKGIHRYESFSLQLLIQFFRHQLKVKIGVERKRLSFGFQQNVSVECLCQVR